jgi:phosphoribosylanthranilate isomerase
MFQIKICGITNVEDAIAAVDAGADAVGLNFYEKSPRYVALRDAHRISVAVTDRGAIPVGVFVNHSFEEIQHAERFSELDALQLHGDEPPEFLSRLIPPTIRARRFEDASWTAIEADLAACRAAGRPPDALLIDAATPGQYGGTGETLPWEMLADHPRWLGDTPLILAGGLTPDNVAEAIRIVRPHGVDVASGVESAPGKKDPVKVRDFIAAARAALDALPPQ